MRFLKTLLIWRVSASLNDLFVAQAFTPGNKEGLVFKSPINGALVACPVSHPGVNAWARENPTMKLGHHDFLH